MKIKDFMTHDHERLEQILRDFLKARDQDGVRARELFNAFKSGVEKHMAWEEEILFPAIERRTGMHLPGPTVLVQSQHRQIKALFEKISAQIDKEGGTEEVLKELTGLLALHSREEERILYPWIDVSLGKEEREAALEQMKQCSTMG
ncbi:hemerythrin domain-containing protein [Candidatus Manganitrophus noduliformans]|nr:hemerythrin domain-containing protein [Candidatus Manganitrophus noduliformans]